MMILSDGSGRRRRNLKEAKDEEAAWRNFTVAEFMSAYDAKDAIYENL